MENGSAHSQDCEVFFADLSAYELLNDRMGMVTDMVCIAVGNNFSIMQHNNTVGYFISAIHIMGNNNGCYAKLVDNI